LLTILSGFIAENQNTSGNRICLSAVQAADWLRHPVKGMWIKRVRKVLRTV